MAVLPMFPLGTVLFPGEVLPLHVFEPRYRQLVQDCLVGVPEFGVVLIERGSEVGGGDARHEVATVAKVAQVAELPDGRYAIMVVGDRRVRVVDWLADDPYPRAEVESLGGSIADIDVDGPPTSDPDRRVLARLRRVLALATEAGYEAPAATSELSEQPDLACYQAAALAPFGPHDKYLLLAAADTSERFALLDGLLEGAEAVLRFELNPPDVADDEGDDDGERGPR